MFYQQKLVLPHKKLLLTTWKIAWPPQTFFNLQNNIYLPKHLYFEPSQYCWAPKSCFYENKCFTWPHPNKKLEFHIQITTVFQEGCQLIYEGHCQCLEASLSQPSVWHFTKTAYIHQIFVQFITFSLNIFTPSNVHNSDRLVLLVYKISQLLGFFIGIYMWQYAGNWSKSCIYLKWLFTI